MQQQIEQFLGTLAGFPFQEGSSLSAGGINYRNNPIVYTVDTPSNAPSNAPTNTPGNVHGNNTHRTTSRCAIIYRLCSGRWCCG